MKILVGVDGRDESRDAVAFAVALARAADGSVDVAAVLDYNPLPIDVNPYEIALREHYGRILDAARDAAGGFPIGEHRLTGSSPAKHLGELAAEIGADLIVVGSTHRSRLGRVLPGTTANALLSGGEVPIAVAPRTGGEGSFEIRKIGVGLDATPEAGHALDAAARWAEKLGAGLKLITVMPNPGPWVAEVIDPAVYEKSMRAQLERALAEASRRVEPLDAETVLEPGNPRQILERESEGLDLLVLGSRGYGPLGRVLLGSVARSVIHEAACPVIVIPRGSEEHATSEPEQSETTAA